MRIMEWTSAFLLVILAIFGCQVQAASLKMRPTNKGDTISTETGSTECKTVSGKTCKFPFIWNGKLYNTCTEDEHTKPWCSTLVDGSNVHVTGEWDDCSHSCKMSDLATANKDFSTLPSPPDILDVIGLSQKYFDDGEEATVEDSPSSRNEEFINVEIGEGNHEVPPHEVPPLARSAHAFHLSDKFDHGTESGQFKNNQVPPEPRSTIKFPYTNRNINYGTSAGHFGGNLAAPEPQYRHPFYTNRNARFEKTAAQLESPEFTQNLVASVKELCSLVGSCHHEPGTGCQFDIGMRKRFPQKYSYRPPIINPFAFPPITPRIRYAHFTPQSRYAPIRSEKSNINIGELGESEEPEEYVNFSRSFDNESDLKDSSTENTSDSDVRIEDGEVDEETKEQMDQMMQILNEVHITPEILDNFPTSRSKRHANLDMGILGMDPIWNYLPMPQVSYIPQYFDEIPMFQSELMFRPPEPYSDRCNCNCGALGRGPISAYNTDDLGSGSDARGREPLNAFNADDLIRSGSDVNDNGMQNGTEHDHVMGNFTENYGMGNSDHVMGNSTEASDAPNENNTSNYNDGDGRQKRSVGYGNHHGINPFYLYSRLAHRDSHYKGIHRNGYNIYGGSFGPYNYGGYGHYGYHPYGGYGHGGHGIHPYADISGY